MKILYLSADLGVPVLGEKGAAVHVRAMVQAFRAEGHRVTLVAPQLLKSPWAEPVALDAVVIQVPPGPETVAATMQMRAFAANVGASPASGGEVRRVLYNQELLAHLRRRFEHDPPDFIYERASLLGVAGATFAGEARVPHLLELNAPLSEEQRRYRQGGALGELLEMAERWVLDRASAVLTVSAPLAAHVTARGVPSARVHVVPNGIDPDRFHPGPQNGDLRRRLQLGDGPIVGFVGGLRPWHGVESLPRLAAALRLTNPDVRVLVVGDGPLRADLARQVAAAGLESHVRLMGAVTHEEVPAYIRLFDVAVAPYPDTPHLFYFSPLKVFEYMACGVPVAAPRAGQIADVIEEGETGVLYQAGDLDGLAARCTELIAAPERRARMGRAAATAVHARYTWAHNARRAMAIVAGMTTDMARANLAPERPTRACTQTTEVTA